MCGGREQAGRAAPTTSEKMRPTTLRSMRSTLRIADQRGEDGHQYTIFSDSASAVDRVTAVALRGLQGEGVIVSEGVAVGEGVAVAACTRVRAGRHTGGCPFFLPILVGGVKSGYTSHIKPVLYISKNTPVPEYTY